MWAFPIANFILNSHENLIFTFPFSIFLVQVIYRRKTTWRRRSEVKGKISFCWWESKTFLRIKLLNFTCECECLWQESWTFVVLSTSICMCFQDDKKHSVSLFLGAPSVFRIAEMINVFSPFPPSSRKFEVSAADETCAPRKDYLLISRNYYSVNE